jgi:cytidylate kinase
MPNIYSTPGASAETDVHRCRLWLNYQFDERNQASIARRWPGPGPAVTISDQTGSGTYEIANRLAALLQAGEPNGAPPWTLFDRQLVEKILEENHLPERLAKFVPEERRSFIEDVIDDLLGLHPPLWTMVPKVVQSILYLADSGQVILVGRGAGFVTGRMPNVFHVRLMASLPKRMERVQKLENLSPKEAAKFIARRDRSRGRYVRAYVHSRLDNDLLYHMVLNTDLIPPSEAAELTAEGARRCFKREQIS